jgi:hypothetical protein
MQAEWEAQRERVLAELPERFGFADLASFVRAMRSAAGARGATESHETRRTFVDGKKAPKSAPATKRQRSKASTKTLRAALPSLAPATAPSSGPTTIADGAPPVAPRAAAVSPQAVEFWPSGTSLDDPKNFGLRPERAVLERGQLSREAFQAKLAEALRFATQVLHTSKVPAVVWREWRSFERELNEARQSLSRTP